MISNYNIVKYCAKYLMLMVVSTYVFSFGSLMANAQSDFMNLISSALFAGLFVGWVLILKSDVTKLVQNIKNKTEKNNE